MVIVYLANDDGLMRTIIITPAKKRRHTKQNKCSLKMARRLWKS